MLTKTPISQVAKVGAGQGAPKQESDFSESGLPFIRAGHLEDLINGLPENELPKVDELTAKKYRLKLYKKGTIVFAKSGMSATKGRIYALKSDCYVVNHLATLEINDSGYSPYIQYALREYSPTKLVKDKAYPSISKPEIESFKIPLPKTKNDQIRIAEVLSKVERLISKRKESINLLDELLKSTFLEMFGSYLNSNIIPLNKLCTKITDGTHDTPERLKSGVKFITGKHIRPFIIDYDNSDYVEEDVHKEIYRRCNPTFGDILYTNIGVNLGTAAMNTVQYEFSMKNVALLKPKFEEITSRYLEHLLNNDYQKRKILRLGGAGGAQSFLSLKEIRSIGIPLPPYKLQQKFSLLVEAVEKLKPTFIKSLIELQNLYNSVGQRAFKGELDLSTLEIDHIIPVSQGGADDEENLQVVSAKENRRISDKPKTTRVGNAIMENFDEKDIAILLKEHFGIFDFRFSEVIEFFENERAVALNYLTSEELKRHRNQLEQDIKTFIFSCVEGKNPHLKLEQKFVNAFEDSELKSVNPRAGRDSILAELNSSPATLELEDISGIYFRIIK